MKNYLLALFVVLFTTSCNMTVQSSIDLSSVRSDRNVTGHLIIDAPLTIRSRIASLLVLAGRTTITSSETSLKTDYTIYKSGAQSTLDEFSWGLYYGRNKTLVLFFRKDFLKALTDAIGVGHDADSVYVRFLLRNDTLYPVTVKVSGSWLDGEPVSGEVVSRVLQPNETTEIVMSRLALHFVLRNGVESVATILF